MNDSSVNLPSGSGLDALIAERIFGLHLGHLDGHRVWLNAENKMVYHTYDSTLPLPSFSTDIAAAWKVVESLGKRDLMLHLMHISVIRSTAVFILNEKKQFLAEACTAPHAICLAALKATT